MPDVLELPGQQAVETQLTGALASGQIAPTWLFHGPEGVGKWAFAHAFARAILCQAPTPWGCGKCPACVRSRVFAHSDLFLLFGLPTGGGSGKARDKFHADFSKDFLDFKRERPLLPYSEGRNRFMPSERIVDLVSWAFRKPGEGARKVAIVYEAELIVRNVVDKLLKLTEEPPDDTTLILVTHRPEQIPATIRSRSRQIRFRRAGPKTLTRFLVDAGNDAAEAAIAVRQSQGCVGIALDLLRQEEANPESSALRLLVDLGRPTPQALAEVQLWQWKSERKRAHTTLEIWAALIHDLALNDLAEPALGTAPGSLVDTYAALREPETAALALELIRDAQAALATNAHIGTTLTAAAGRLAHLGAGRLLPARFWPRTQKV